MYPRCRRWRTSARAAATVQDQVKDVAFVAHFITRFYPTINLVPDFDILGQKIITLNQVPESFQGALVEFFVSRTEDYQDENRFFLQVSYCLMITPFVTGETPDGSCLVIRCYD